MTTEVPPVYVQSVVGSLGRFVYESASLSNSLPMEEQRRCVVLVTLRGDQPDEQQLRVELDVAFQAVTIYVSGIHLGLGKQLFYAAARGGIFSVTSEGNEILEHTEPRGVAVQYAILEEDTRESRVRLAPEATMNDVSVRPGAIVQSRTSRRARSSKFKLEESTLQVVRSPGRVRWDFVAPRHASVMQDFVQGNVRLMSVIRWRSASRVGKVHVEPLATHFYDAERRPLGPWRSLFMKLALLVTRPDTIRNYEGFVASFSVDESEESP